jgi:aminocarboxymuconate-semialdehyde decarboxylase
MFGNSSWAAAKSRRRDGGPVVDAHAHWYPEEWLKAVEADGAGAVKVSRAGEGWSMSSPTLTLSVTPDYVDIPKRLRNMDEQGVDVHALSLSVPMVHWASPELGLKLSRIYNDAASKACMDHPKRFVAMAALPMHAPELALPELERASALPGMRGLYMATNINGKELDDPGFFPIYSKCEKLGWPIFLHPVQTIGMDRTTRYYLRNLLGNPYDTGNAAARLIFGGVLDTFPALEIMLPHAGGAFPQLVGRMDHGAQVRPELKDMKKPPSAYLRRFTYDTITHNDAILVNLIRMVGADRVVLGSDYPFDMGYPHPVQVIERLAQVPAKDRDQILGGTAARLLKITS